MNGGDGFTGGKGSPGERGGSCVSGYKRKKRSDTPRDPLNDQRSSVNAGKISLPGRRGKTRHDTLDAGFEKHRESEPGWVVFLSETSVVELHQLYLAEVTHLSEKVLLDLPHSVHIKDNLD